MTGFNGTDLTPDINSYAIVGDFADSAIVGNVVNGSYRNQGILLGGGSYSTNIANNTIGYEPTGVGAHAIAILGGATNIKVLGNSFTGCTGVIISDAGTGTIIANNN